MKGVRKIISEVIEIPSETVGSCPLITIAGKDKIIIENSKGIAKYESDILRVNTSIGIAEVTGKNIVLKTMGPECIIAEGIIESFRFI